MKAKYRVLLSPDRVQAMKEKSRLLSYERGVNLSWCDLLRAGAELALAESPDRLLALCNNHRGVIA